MWADDKPPFFIARFGAAVRLFFCVFNRVRIGAFATAETGNTGQHRKPQPTPDSAARIVKNSSIRFKAFKGR